MPTSPELLTPQARRSVTAQQQLFRFTESSTVAAGVMLAAAIAAVIIANSPLQIAFGHLWETGLSLSIGSFSLDMTLELFVNDFLMAIFFLVVGLEIKYEVTVGELTDVRRALLPVLGAVGGVAVPIVIYLLFNSGTESAGGWGVPTATDIAFALGILSILGNRVPSGLRVFLSTLAIVDDIIAILVIAIFYGHTPDVFWLGMACIVVVALLVLNRMHVYRIRWYMVFGLILWFCVYQSGIHATIAGVLLAACIPSRSPVHPKAFSTWVSTTMRKADGGYRADRPVLAQDAYIDHIDDISKVANLLTPPLSTLKKAIEPFSSFVVLPLFALANAGVRFVGVDVVQMVTSPAVLGIFLGLVLGKPVGITAMSALAVKTHLSDLPDGVSWGQMIGASVLGGLGFTMSILVAGLAFADAAVLMEAKAAILMASLVAGIVGFVLLARRVRR